MRLIYSKIICSRIRSITDARVQAARNLSEVARTIDLPKVVRVALRVSRVTYHFGGNFNPYLADKLPPVPVIVCGAIENKDRKGRVSLTAALAFIIPLRSRRRAGKRLKSQLGAC